MECSLRFTTVRARTVAMRVDEMYVKECAVRARQAARADTTFIHTLFE